MKTTCLGSTLTLLAFASSAIAGDVFVVGPSGTHATIQAAIDAAADYDTILVVPLPGTQHHASFVLDGRSLAILGHPASTNPVRVAGENLVEATPGGGFVVLGKLALRGSSLTGHALRSQFNAGSVWLEGCDAVGAEGTVGGAEFGGPAAISQSDADIQLVACKVDAGDHGWAESGAGSVGPYGLSSTGSLLRLIGCTLTGGHGILSGGDEWNGGAGGHALVLTDGVALAIASTFTGGGGGLGGWDEDCPGIGGWGGAGGHGALVTSSATPADLRTRGSQLAGGPGGAGGPGCTGSGPSGSPGQPAFTVGGTWTQLTGVPRRLSGVPSVRENSGAALTATGSPGDKVFLQVGEITSPLSPLAVAAPNHLPVAPTKKPEGVYIGTIPASGTLDATLPIVALPIGTESMWLKLRPLFVDTTGATFYGNGFVLVVIDSSF